MTTPIDRGLDQLLALDGEVLVLHADGPYWVKFEVKRVPATPSRPHGISYSLTLHGPDNERLVGFDNAHPVPPTKWGQPQDHRHKLQKATPYEYQDAITLLEAFWAAVDGILQERGITP